MNKIILLLVLLISSISVAKGTLVLEPSKYESHDNHSMLAGFEVDQPITSFIHFKNETGLNWYKMTDQGYAGYKFTDVGFKNGVEVTIMKLKVMPYFNLMYFKGIETAEKQYGLKVSYEMWE